MILGNQQDLLDKEDDVARRSKQHHAHEENVLPLERALSALVGSGSGVAWLTLVTENASIARSAPPFRNVVGII